MMAESAGVKVFVRMPESLVEQIDAYAAEMVRAYPGARLNRADAIRDLIIKGLDTLKREREGQR